MSCRVKCEDCVFWGREREHDLETPYGTCRVNPPRVRGKRKLSGGPRVPRAAWPWTAFDDWCAHASPLCTPAGGQPEEEPPRYVTTEQLRAAVRARVEAVGVANYLKTSMIGVPPEHLETFLDLDYEPSADILRALNLSILYQAAPRAEWLRSTE